jgi:hypothetical protein
MLLNEGMLLLKGWFEENRVLRVSVESGNLRIVTTCTIYKIEKAHIAFHISESDYFECSLAGCAFNFADAKEDAKEMPVGLTAESAILAVRDGFKALIVLLEQ